MEYIMEQRKRLFRHGKMKKDLELAFQLRTEGKKLDLEEPKTFSEKMQWIKFSEVLPVKSRLSDKYLAKAWINERLGGDYAVPTLGVWDSFDDVEYDKLPNKFVLKANHGTKNNVYVIKEAEHIVFKNLNGEEISIKEAKSLFDYWMKLDYTFVLLYEFDSYKIEPKIIAEYYLAEKKEYKFMCVNGRIEFIWDFTPYYENEKLVRATTIFSDKWEKFNWTTDKGYPTNPNDIPKPEKLDEMLWIAKELSRDFSVVRVDLYVAEDRVYVGELTFMPGGGVFDFSDPDIDRQIGDRFVLPRPTPITSID